MFLKRIRIENIRCLTSAEVSFERSPSTDPSRRPRPQSGDEPVRKWTFITGDNGSGKSTILKCIALVMAGSEGLLELLHAPEHWIRNGQDAGRIDAVLTTKDGQEREIALTLRRGQNKRELLRDNAESLKRLDDALEHTSRNYLTIAYGGSRHSNESGFGLDGETFHHPRARAMATLFADHAPMVPFEMWAMDLRSREPKASSKILGQAMEGLLPNVTFSRFDTAERQLIFRTPDGEVPLRQLSSGYRSVVGFCGDLLYRITDIFQDYRSPLNARGLLLIDELGLHLHPRWQRIVVDFLTSKLPNLQLVVTTNSPVTAHQADQDELYYLVRDEQEVPVLHHFEGAPNKLLLHQLILSPVFGLDTANSHLAEADREEYRRLKRKKNPASSDRKRMKELAQRIAEFTSWDEVTDQDRQMKQLLQSVGAKVGALIDPTDGGLA